MGPLLAAMRCLRSISAEAGQGFESSLPDTPDGKCPLLLATALTMESLPASTKVVEPSTGRITLRCRPVESVGFQSCILAIVGAATAEQGIKSRAASGQERFVRRFTPVIR